MIRILTLGIQFFMLNSRQTKDGKKVLAEGMDVITAIGKAMKDKKITNDEKKAVVKELKEFSKAATDLLDSIVIPE
tara:strand:+ start:29 stop:256 length:228 start_codon:yes stop_codon:yes gene_type:complete